MLCKGVVVGCARAGGVCLGWVGIGVWVMRGLHDLRVEGEVGVGVEGVHVS